MQGIIESYRKCNYTGLIQVVEIDVDGNRWFYNSNKSLQEDIKNHGFEEFCLVGIHHYTDNNQNLEVTCISFTINNINIFNRKISSELKGSDRTIPYYKKLRQFIGNNTLFCMGMCVIIEKENKIAVAKRTDTGEWSLPAGMKELSETIIENVHGEIMEELGISIHKPELKAITSGLKNRVRYPNGDQIKFVNFLFYARYKDGILQPNDNENLEVKWIEKDKVEEILSERFLYRYKIYQNCKDRVIVI